MDFFLGLKDVAGRGQVRHAQLHHWIYSAWRKIKVVAMASDGLK